MASFTPELLDEIRARVGHRRAGRPVGEAQEGRRELEGALPLPRREDAVLHRQPEEGHLPLLRLRGGRRRLQLPACARTGSTFPEAVRVLAQRAGVALPDGRRRARRRTVRPRGALRAVMARAAPLLRRGALEGGRAERARDVPRRARHRPRGGAALRPRLGARGLGQPASALCAARASATSSLAGRPASCRARTAPASTTASAAGCMFPIRDAAGSRGRLRRPRASATSSRSTSTRRRRRST